MTENADQTAGTSAGNAAVGSGRLGAWLTLLLGMPVLGFFCFAAFGPASLRVPLAGGTVTVWYAYGLGLIGFSLLLGLVYVLATNRAADRLGRTLTVAAAILAARRSRPG